MEPHLKVIVQKFNAGALLHDKEERIDKNYFSTYRTILRSRVASDNVESQTYVTGIRKVPKFRTGELEDNDEDKYVRPKYTKKAEKAEISEIADTNDLHEDKSRNNKNNKTTGKPVGLVIRKKPQLLGGPLEDDENDIIEIKNPMDNSTKKKHIKGRKKNSSESEGEILKLESQKPKLQELREKPKYLGGPLEDDEDILTHFEIEKIALRNQKMTVSIQSKPKYLGGPLQEDEFEEEKSRLAETLKPVTITQKPKYNGGAIEDDQELESEKPQTQGSIEKKKKASIRSSQEEEAKSRADQDGEKEIKEIHSNIVIQKHKNKRNMLEDDIDEDDLKDKQKKERKSITKTENHESEQNLDNQPTSVQNNPSELMKETNETGEEDEGEAEEVEEEEEKHKNEHGNSSGIKAPKKITFKTTPEEEGSVFNHEKAPRRFRKKKLTDVVEAREEDEERNRSNSRGLSSDKNSASPSSKFRRLGSHKDTNSGPLNQPYPFDIKNVQPRYMLPKGKSHGSLEDVEKKENSQSKDLKRAQSKSKGDLDKLDSAEEKNEELERANSLEKIPEQRETMLSPVQEKMKEEDKEAAETEPEPEKEKEKVRIVKSIPKKPVLQEKEPRAPEEPKEAYSSTVKTHKYLKSKTRNYEPSSSGTEKSPERKDLKEKEESSDPEVPYSTTVKTHKFLKRKPAQIPPITKKEEPTPQEPSQVKEAENVATVKRIPIKNKFGQYRTGKIEDGDSQGQDQETGKPKADQYKEEIAQALKKNPAPFADDSKLTKSQTLKPKTLFTQISDDSEDNMNNKRELGKLITQKLVAKGFQLQKTKSYKTSDDEFGHESARYSDSDNENSAFKSLALKKVQSSFADIDTPRESGAKGLKISLPKFKSEKEIGTIELPPISAKGSGSKTQGLSSSRSVTNFSWALESPEKNGKSYKEAEIQKDNLLREEKRKHSNGTQEVLDKLFAVVKGEENKGKSLGNLESKPLGLKRNQSMGIALKIPQTQQDLASPDSERVYPATARNRVIVKREINNKPVSKEADDVPVKKEESNLNNGVKRTFKIRTASKEQIILKPEMNSSDKNIQNATRT